MTRVRICIEHPGTIVRPHDFKNFPQGTTPHTTAPFDYSILGLAVGLSPAENSVGRILDRTAASAPPHPVLSGQNRTAKLFRFADKL